MRAYYFFKKITFFKAIKKSKRNKLSLYKNAYYKSQNKINFMLLSGLKYLFLPF